MEKFGYLTVVVLGVLLIGGCKHQSLMPQITKSSSGIKYGWFGYKFSTVCWGAHYGPPRMCAYSQRSSLKQKMTMVNPIKRHWNLYCRGNSTPTFGPSETQRVEAQIKWKITRPTMGTTFGSATRKTRVTCGLWAGHALLKVKIRYDSFSLRAWMICLHCPLAVVL